MDEDEVAVRSQILRQHIHEIEELIERLLPAAKAGSISDRDKIVSLQRQVFGKRERLRTLPAEEI
tara:strand:+ start:117 stop:311 length:195 start_codon:yes stop_codon:yes gene_type:complete